MLIIYTDGGFIEGPTRRTSWHDSSSFGLTGSEPPTSRKWLPLDEIFGRLYLVARRNQFSV